jgi:hypothetical protein
MNHQKKTGLSPFALFRVFPIANKFLFACLIVIASLNGALFLLATVNPPLLSRWVGTTEFLTNWVSHFFPGIDQATTVSLHSHPGNRGVELIPAIRNALAFNFLVLLPFPIATVLAAIVDLKKGGVEIYRNIDRVVANTGREFSFFLLGAPLFTAFMFILVFLGYAVSPPVLDLRFNYVGYAVLFFSCDMFISTSVVLVLILCLRPGSDASAASTKLHGV